MTPGPTAGAGPVAEDVVLGDLGPVPSVGAAEVARGVAASGRRLVVLDDDPTGTQTVADVPVLTTWTVADMRWGLRQNAPAFYVLTNTRSLSPPAAGARTAEVVEALVDAAAAEGTDYVVVSRSDSTLRGHFPLETDVIGEVLTRRTGVEVDGVVIVPAYVEGGRMTVDSVHWVRTAAGLVRAGHSEFAADATFGYRSSDLRDYVEEKSAGRWKAAEVSRITLAELRSESASVERTLLAAGGGGPIVVDAVADEDLRALALALLAAEAAGKRFVYRVGPSFVRARAGLEARRPLTASDLRAISRTTGRATDLPATELPATDVPAAIPDADVPAVAHGLVIVGSHVQQTTRQIQALRDLGGISEIELDVDRLLDDDRRAGHITDTVEAAAADIEARDVAIVTSRTVVTGADVDTSLDIARTVSAAVVAVVARLIARRRPAWVVAKGGITSSDVATEALGIRRAWARGTLLPGIISVWEPVVSDLLGVPYVVFAGNVGDDSALAAVVSTLRGDI